MDFNRWQRLLQLLDAKPELDTYSILFNAYCEPHRYYHTITHIKHCLYEFDQVQFLAHFPADLELALWFHDVIYEPLSNNNERASVDMVLNFLKIINASPDRCQRIAAYIMATMHGTSSNLEVDNYTNDMQLIADIDLSILGQHPAKYEQFENDIRKEYRLIPWYEYRAKRSELLKFFINKSIIYHFEPFLTRYEAQARANIQAAIDRLNNS